MYWLSEDTSEAHVCSVLARRASRRPMDGHFWGKYIQNSLNLLKNLQETLLLGWPTFNFWLKACMYMYVIMGNSIHCVEYKLFSTNIAI